MTEHASSTTAVSTPVFATVASKPNHPEIEHRLMAWWDENGVFDALRERNANGPKFSYIDGPITANNKMGVHHAWGRTLKDVYQRLYAARGYDQRYQNGFDCQGLWVEVEVEKALGLNSKPEIEEYGLDKFARACRDRVAEFSEIQTEQSKRLGQWMDWDNDYYTMSDTNISYIWQFLAKCKERDWLYVGHRPMVWCPRCGTSLSQHELIDSYDDVTHPSLFVRFPLLDRPGQSVAIWTTTPWTLPANVAAAVKADATYSLVQHSDPELGAIWMAQDRVESLFGEDAQILQTAPGTELVGLRYDAPFSHLPATEDAQHVVVAWDEVSMDEGTGIVHIAPGCGAEDYELGKTEGLASIQPVNESGIFVAGFGEELEGLTTHDAAPVVIGDLKARGRLLKSATITHRFPKCWRCSTELIFRLVDEWFIRCDEIRPLMIEANRKVEWVPSFYGKRMEDWLNNMGDWCISRKRYWGLPLPFYRDPADESGEIFVVESLEHLRQVAVDPDAVDALPELHKPWIDDIKVRHPETGAILERVPEVGDCWLDAGIVPFATMGWNNPERVPGGYATGASLGLSGADLPSHEEWEQWFPADCVIEMREQIRLWFYSLLFMSVVLDGRAPYRRVLAYEKVQDENGRAMHKSWGNAIWFDDAAEEFGADIMRWMYAAQNPAQNLNFGPTPANEVKRRFLTLWNVYSFFVTYANADGWQPSDAAIERVLSVDSCLSPARYENRLDRWLAARTQNLVAEIDTAFERWDTTMYTRVVESYVEELSNWYVRRSRRRFWKAEDGVEDQNAAYETLWSALITLSRVLSPVMPFLADELWSNLVGSIRTTSDTAARLLPESVHLTPWPQASAEGATDPLLAEVSAVQRIVALGRAARSASKLKLRQPLREVVVFRRSARGSGTDSLATLVNPHLEDIRSELSIKEVTLVDDPGGRWTEGLMPLLPKLGPKYGPQVADIRKAVASGDIEPLAGGRIRVGAFELEKDEYEHRSQAGDGYAVAEDAEWVVAVSTTLDDELIREGTARECVRFLQQARKDIGLEISDRIRVRWEASGILAEALTAHADVIADEVLAVEMDSATLDHDSPDQATRSYTVGDQTAWVHIERA